MKHLLLLVAAHNKKPGYLPSYLKKNTIFKLSTISESPLHLHYIILLFFRKINFTHHVKRKASLNPT